MGDECDRIEMMNLWEKYTSIVNRNANYISRRNSFEGEQIATTDRLHFG